MILPRAFYARDTATVARELLGQVLVHGETAGMIVETEAYLGRHDLAAHSAAGITPRTSVIFGEPGHAYVYLSYGLHWCLNIVAEAAGQPGCVLLRALEPVAGLDIMRQRRPACRRDHELASGPGNLTRAMGITRVYYAADLTQGALTVRAGTVTEPAVMITTRIGITRSEALPLRFFIRGNPSVSGKNHLPKNL